MERKDLAVPSRKYCDNSPCKKKLHTKIEKFRCCIGCPDEANCDQPCKREDGCEHIVTREVILWKTVLC